jgi:hypothetical protein
MAIMGPTRIERIIPTGGGALGRQDQEKDGKIILIHSFWAWTVRIGLQADSKHT